MIELQGVVCHVWPHNVTCHPTQANTSRLNPSHYGWYSIYLPRLPYPGGMGGWVNLGVLITPRGREFRLVESPTL